MWASLSFMAIEGFTRLALRTFAFHYHPTIAEGLRAEREAGAQAGAWAGLGFPATLYSRSGVGVGVDQNVGKAWPKIDEYNTAETKQGRAFSPETPLQPCIHDTRGGREPI
jgi:hypothetical protein